MKIAIIAAIAVAFAGRVQPAHADPASEVSARPIKWAQSVADAHVNNLHRITPTLYRSAQLSRSDVPELQKLGIRKVISFRSFHADDTILARRSGCSASGSTRGHPRRGHGDRAEGAAHGRPTARC